MQGTQYATKRSILCRGAFCGPTVQLIIILGVNCEDCSYPLVLSFVLGSQKRRRHINTIPTTHPLRHISTIPNSSDTIKPLRQLTELYK